LRLRARFQSPLVPGGEITLEHGPGAAGDVHFRVRSAQGDLALALGYARIAA
jgi:hypothetical protein